MALDDDIGPAIAASSRDRSIALLASLPAAALLLDRDRIVWANEEATALLGAGAIAGKPFADVLPLAWIGDNPAAGPRRCSEHSIFPADGKERRLEACITAWPTSTAPERRLVLLHDVTERRMREDALLRRLARLRRLTAHRDVRQREASLHAAHELHDTLQQPLAAMLYELTAVGDHLAGLAPVEAAAIRRVGDIARAALSSTSAVIETLRPSLHEDLGVLDATQALARRFERRSGIRCRVRARGFADDQACAGSPADAFLLCDAVAEALDNVARHARASRVRIALVRDNDCALHLRILDDGIGLDNVVLDRAAFGLHGLVERVHASGGRLSLGRGRPRGTQIEIHLPGQSREVGGEALDDGLPPEHSYIGLLRFLYRVPVGLIEAEADGSIRLINPAAARMLRPLAGRDGLANLFDLLRAAVPDLSKMLACSGGAAGVPCDDVAIAIPGTLSHQHRGLALSVQRLQDGRLVAVLEADDTATRQAEPSEDFPAR